MQNSLLVRFKSSCRIKLLSTVRKVVPSLPSGLCPVYKPVGWSSSDVVQRVRSVLEKEYQPKKRSFKPIIKVGHGGTLDPMAEGVLILGIGEGTKLMKDYLSGAKGYKAIALLGQEMDTLDSTGSVISTVDCTHISVAQLSDSLLAFTGNILQTPPMFSALKRDGKPLYELARKGIEVERQPRPVTVYSLKLLDTKNEPQLPHFALDVECSGGFYIRSLISDLAKKVGGVAHMTSLTRYRQGLFDTNDCLQMEELSFDMIKEHIEVSSKKAQLDIVSMKLAHNSKDLY